MNTEKIYKPGKDNIAGDIVGKILGNKKNKEKEDEDWGEEDDD